MKPKMTYSEVQSKASQCTLKALELQACFAVISAALTGEADMQSKSLDNLEINHVISLLDVFAGKSEDLCVLMDEVDHGYRAIIEGLEKQIAEGREVQS